MAKLSIIIPAFNEAAMIREDLTRVREVPIGPIEKEIVVDDASTDGTRELLIDLRIF